MPIQGYTDKGAALPKILDIRKGAKKTEANKPGADLDYFRAVGDTETMRAFAELFGGKPQAIEFMSPYNTMAETFEAWKEEYAAGGLKHRCDGVKTVRRQLKDGSYTDDPIDCPGGCKQVGRLNIVIPGLKRLGIVTVHTTSIWDIISISQQLFMIESLRGSLRGIPLILRRVKRSISTPSGSDGKRARRDKWLLSIEPSPKWVEKQLEAMERAALPSADSPLMLTAGVSVPDADDDENDEGEALCSPETAAAIEKLWPEFGGRRKDGSLIPLADFLKGKGFDSIKHLPEDSAKTTLDWLQKQAVAKQQTATPVVETKPEVQKLGWECGEDLAQEIVALKDDLLKSGVTEKAYDDELSELCGGGAVSVEIINRELAEAWIKVLKSWVNSRAESE